MVSLQRVHHALSIKFPDYLLDALLSTFTTSVAKLNAGDFSTCLVQAGLFSEHALRALIFDATGSLPSEIKNVSDAVQTLKKAGGSSESVSILIPSILASTAYNLRSKRGAVHVKGVNPEKRDAVLAVTALSWTLAEFLSVYGNIIGNEMDGIIASLMRRKVPLVEQIAGDLVVTATLPAYAEALLIIDGHPQGVSRRELGKLVKRSPSSITHALTKLEAERLAHQSAGLWFITGKGEEALQAYH